MNIIKNINKNSEYFISQTRSFTSDLNAKISSVVRTIFEFAADKVLSLAGSYHMMTKDYMAESTANIVAITVGSIALISLTIIILTSCKGNQKKNEVKETNDETDNKKEVDINNQEEKVETKPQDKELIQNNNIYEVIKNLDDNIETIGNRDQDFVDKTNSIDREIDWSLKNINKTKNKNIHECLEKTKNILSKILENKNDKTENIENNTKEALKSFKETLAVFKKTEKTKNDLDLKTKIDLDLKTKKEKKTNTQILAEIKTLKKNLFALKNNDGSAEQTALSTNYELSEFLEKTKKITSLDINKHLDEIRNLHTSLSALIKSVGPEGQVTKTEKTAFKNILYKLSEILKNFTSDLNSKI